MKYSIKFERTISFFGDLTIEAGSEDEAEALVSNLAKNMDTTHSWDVTFSTDSPYDIDWDLNDDTIDVIEILEE
jgi:hypothetical protein